MKLKTKQELFRTMLLAISVALAGCSGTTTTDGTVTNTTTTNLSAISPTGTIQGVLIDAVTQQPIVGALIDIGMAAAWTNQNGQFVIANVPATNIGTGAAGGTTLVGTYQVSINLKNVTSPINMADPTIVKRYPDFSYKTAQVFYTSDVTHPLTGVANGYQFTVGKQAATVAGVVTDATGKPAPAGYNVTLYSALNAQNSATGGTGQGPVVNTGSNTGHIISTTTTNATGNFTFANIEAGIPIVITAQDTANTLYGERAITAPTENATRTLTFQNNDAVVVASKDVLPPNVISVTPANFSDITPAATSVVFTFSEPIKQTSAVADVSPSNPNGLYSKVNVNFTGPKPLASNLAHSLAWSVDRTQLTVTLPALGASSMYTVDISPAVTAALITDDAGNAMAAAVAPATATTVKQAVNFTTNGGATAVAPTIALVNSALINSTSLTTGAPVAATLNWLPTSGAKGYNVYRTMKEVWPTTTVVHPTVKVNATAIFTTGGTDAFVDVLPPAAPLDYVGLGAVKQTYDYVVTAINSDGTESAASSAVTAADVIAPALAAAVPQKAVVCAAAVTCDPITGKIKDITIPFDEQMDKASATTVGNYVSALLGTFSSAVYTPATAAVVAPATTLSITVPATVKLTLTTPVAPLSVTAVPFGYITTGANGINNTTAAVGDVAAILTNNGSPNAVCVRAGAVGANPNAVATAANPLVPFTATTAGYLSTGAAGVCLVAAVAGVAPAPNDVQVLPVGTGVPNTVAINPGATGILATPIVANSPCVTAPAVGATAMTEVPVGDDRFVMGTAVTASYISSGANGICETAKTGTDLQTITVGNARVGALDDELVPAAAVVTVTGVKDVAGNALAGKTRYNADGSVN